ncbi:FAR1-related sequence 5-like protein [Tanacetum coccineum]
MAEQSNPEARSRCDDDKLVGLFWADEQAIRDYVIFGDIVSFDATFSSNKYKEVLVTFTGINHHNRCITFASGLLSDETVGAYKWLLEEFKNSFGKDPNVVITNQDPSMKIAILECFPNTRRRLCMWHIMQKLVTKIGPVAYKLELPEEFINVHNTFHVSNLKKCLSDESLIIPMKELQLDDKLNFVEEPVEIMDREIKQLK